LVFLISVHHSKYNKTLSMPKTTLNKHGGQRSNAGRKKGSSVYGESTTAIRVPESLVPTIKTLLTNRKQQFEQLANGSAAILFPSKKPSSIALPLFTGKVQ
jgi:DNA polymerase V